MACSLVTLGRHRVQRGVGVGDADRFGLGAVDQVAEDPADAADRLAVRGHAALAVLTPAALGDGGDEHAVTDAESLDGIADLGDRADGLVAEDAAVGDGGHVAVQDVQVGAADRGGVDLDHDVGRFPDGCIGDVFPRLLARSVVYRAFIEPTLAILAAIGCFKIGLGAGVAFGQVGQRDRDRRLAARCDHGLPRGQVGDERAQSGQPAAARPGVGADAARRRAGEDVQEPGRTRVLGRDAEGVQRLAAGRARARRPRDRRRRGTGRGWCATAAGPGRARPPRPRGGQPRPRRSPPGPRGRRSCRRSRPRTAVTAGSRLPRRPSVPCAAARGRRNGGRPQDRARRPAGDRRSRPARRRSVRTRWPAGSPGTRRR